MRLRLVSVNNEKSYAKMTAMRLRSFFAYKKSETKLTARVPVKRRKTPTFFVCLFMFIALEIVKSWLKTRPASLPMS